MTFIMYGLTEAGGFLLCNAVIGFQPVSCMSQVYEMINSRCKQGTDFLRSFLRDDSTWIFAGRKPIWPYPVAIWNGVSLGFQRVR